jgi:hypothetical protein
MTDKEAMKLALDALETECDIYREHDEDGAPEYILEAMTALKERLAQDKALQALHNENERLGLYRDAYAEQEPVKWADYEPDGMHHNKPPQRTEQEPVAILNHAHGVHTFRNVNLKGLPDGEYLVYTHPAQRTEENT